MATPDYMIVDGAGNFVMGPLKKGKLKRTLASMDPSKYFGVHYRASAKTATPQAEPTKEEVKEEVPKESVQETADKQLESMLEPAQWQFRSSTYTREEAANELVQRLSLTEFEVVKVSKGWYVNYNDTD